MDVIHMEKSKPQIKHNHTYISPGDLKRIINEATHNVDAWIRPWVESDGKYG